MAEWLRREIRNLLGSPRAGSNPVRSDLFSFPCIEILPVYDQINGGYEEELRGFYIYCYQAETQC